MIAAFGHLVSGLGNYCRFLCVTSFILCVFFSEALSAPSSQPIFSYTILNQTANEKAYSIANTYGLVTGIHHAGTCAG
jgi:hypothetical protein